MTQRPRCCARTGKARRQHLAGDGHRRLSERTGQDLSEDSRYQAATGPASMDHAGPQKRRTMSKAGRVRIAAAQRQDGRAEEATGATGQARRTGEAQEADDVGGGVEGDHGSHHNALGYLPESREGGGLISLSAIRKTAVAAFDSGCWRWNWGGTDAWKVRSIRDHPSGSNVGFARRCSACLPGTA